jgi:hypothetical protein
MIYIGILANIIVILAFTYVRKSFVVVKWRFQH